jgi:hypothetical protein
MVGPTVVDTGKQIWATLISHHLQCCCLGSAHIFGICGHIESDIYIIILFIFNISKCHSILENDVVGAMAPTGPSWSMTSKRLWLTCLFIIFICYCILGLVAASSSLTSVNLATMQCRAYHSVSSKWWKEAHQSPRRRWLLGPCIVAKCVPPFGDCVSLVLERTENYSLC